MLHHFHSGQHPKGQGSISQDEFEQLLNFVRRERIITPQEWLRRLAEGQLREGDLCLTLDDALLCQFDIALPILEKYGLNAFWFVYSNVFEGNISKFEVYRAFRSKYFNNIDAFYKVFFTNVFKSEFGDRARAVIEKTDTTQIKKAYPFYSANDIHFRAIRDQTLTRPQYEKIMDELMAAYGVDVAKLAATLWMSNSDLLYLHTHGHIIGLHSYSHPMTLSRLPTDSQREEYERNVSHITKMCGTRPVAMAHPVNSYSDATLAILAQLGIQCGFRANMFPPAPGEPLNRTTLELAREDHANIIRMIKG